MFEKSHGSKQRAYGYSHIASVKMDKVELRAGFKMGKHLQLFPRLADNGCLVANPRPIAGLGARAGMA
jgi:hypothetical protein